MRWIIDGRRTSIGQNGSIHASRIIRNSNNTSTSITRGTTGIRDTSSMDTSSSLLSIISRPTGEMLTTES